MFEKYLTKTGRLSTSQPQDIKNQWWIHRFQEVHGNTYDYSNVVYSGAKQKVEIICREHGVFPQTPDNHQAGKGCPQCYKGSKQKPVSQFILEAQKVHGTTYDYSSVTYSGAKQEVSINCKIHGAFTQRADDHLNGRGCPKCQNHNQDTLYILRCKDTGLIKIGITNNLKQRIASIGGSMEYVFHINMDNPRELEKHLHLKYTQFQEFNPNVRTGGTEFFRLDQSQLQELINVVTRSNQ